MREQFDSELMRIKEISKYNQERASVMLDDMGSAYLYAYDNNEHLDKSLLTVRVSRKSLKAKGYAKDFINDYFIQRSYLSKTTLKSLSHESIFLSDESLNPMVERCLSKTTIAMFDGRTTTDLIIDQLQGKPELLSALQRGISKSGLTERYGVSNPVLLQNFYNKHKDIIN